MQGAWISISGRFNSVEEEHEGVWHFKTWQNRTQQGTVFLPCAAARMDRGRAAAASGRHCCTHQPYIRCLSLTAHVKLRGSNKGMGEEECRKCKPVQRCVVHHSRTVAGRWNHEQPGRRKKCDAVCDMATWCHSWIYINGATSGVQHPSLGLHLAQTAPVAKLGETLLKRCVWQARRCMPLSMAPATAPSAASNARVRSFAALLGQLPHTRRA